MAATFYDASVKLKKKQACADILCVACAEYVCVCGWVCVCGPFVRGVAPRNQPAYGALFFAVVEGKVE